MLYIYIGIYESYESVHIQCVYMYILSISIQEYMLRFTYLHEHADGIGVLGLWVEFRGLVVFGG